MNWGKETNMKTPIVFHLNQPFTNTVILGELGSDPARRFSLIEGKDPSQRVSPRALFGDLGNPPATIYGFVADYDACFDVIPAIGLVAKSSNPPQCVVRTKRGHVRLIWTFAPRSVGSMAEAVQVLTQFAKTVGAAKLLPGFDQVASRNPCTYWLENDLYCDLNHNSSG
jgi:hypothetical protein